MRLLMTGLYENVSKLQNEKSLTFLYRTPKIQMDPLSIGAITSNYATYLKIDYDKAIKLAKFTKGYAFAYQTLGFILFEKNKKILMMKFCVYLINKWMNLFITKFILKLVVPIKRY